MRLISTNTLTMKSRPAELLHSGFAIFPCHKKIPVTKHGVKDATTSFDEVFAWIRIYPNAFWGIACGERSGIVVLDVDLSDVPMAKTLAELGRKGMPGQNVVRTPSGGYHFYCAWQPGLRNKVRLGGLPLDIRTDGGDVIGHGKGYDRVRWTGKFEPVPDWVVEECKPKPISVRAAPKPVSGDGTMQANLMMRAREGERNHKLFSLACWAFDSGGDLDALADAAKRVGLSDFEIRRTLDSARRQTSEK